MTSNSLPRVFALAPIGIEGFAIAAAASRANALGIIDFSFGEVPDPARSQPPYQPAEQRARSAFESRHAKSFPDPHFSLGQLPRTSFVYRSRPRSRIDCSRWLASSGRRIESQSPR